MVGCFAGSHQTFSLTPCEFLQDALSDLQNGVLAPMLIHAARNPQRAETPVRHDTEERLTKEGSD